MEQRVAIGIEGTVRKHWFIHHSQSLRTESVRVFSFSFVRSFVSNHSNRRDLFVWFITLRFNEMSTNCRVQTFWKWNVELKVFAERMVESFWGQKWQSFKIPFSIRRKQWLWFILCIILDLHQFMVEKSAFKIYNRKMLQVKMRSKTSSNGIKYYDYIKMNELTIWI